MIYRNRRVDSLNVSLFDENFAGFCTQNLHLVLLDDLTSLELLDLPIEIAVLAHTSEVIGQKIAKLN